MSAGKIANGLDEVFVGLGLVEFSMVRTRELVLSDVSLAHKRVIISLTIR
jgi:hypothetical protein